MVIQDYIKKSQIIIIRDYIKSGLVERKETLLMTLDNTDCRCNHPSMQERPTKVKVRSDNCRHEQSTSLARCTSKNLLQTLHHGFPMSEWIGSSIPGQVLCSGFQHCRPVTPSICSSGWTGGVSVSHKDNWSEGICSVLPHSLERTAIWDARP